MPHHRRTANLERPFSFFIKWSLFFTSFIITATGHAQCLRIMFKNRGDVPVAVAVMTDRGFLSDQKITGWIVVEPRNLFARVYSGDANYFRLAFAMKTAEGRWVSVAYEPGDESSRISKETVWYCVPLGMSDFTKSGRGAALEDCKESEVSVPFTWQITCRPFDKDMELSVNLHPKATDTALAYLDRHEPSLKTRKPQEQSNGAGDFSKSPAFQTLAGLNALRHGKDAEAVECFSKAASQGDATAQYALGMLHFNGRGGLSTNEVTATEWLEKAAEKNHSEALFFLGWMHENGRGGAEGNLNIAIARYYAAGKQGNAKGYNASGILLEGSGFKELKDMALKCYWLAAQGGLNEGKSNWARLVTDNKKQMAANAAVAEKQSPKPQFVVDGEALIKEHGGANGVLSSEQKNSAPLRVAVGKNSAKLVEFLIAKGANVNAKYDDLETPLHIAAMCDCAEAAAVLVRGGAELNTKARENNHTPLFEAVHQGMSGKGTKMISLLLDSGADVNAADSGGKTSLDWVLNTDFDFLYEERKENRDAVTKILRDSGAKQARELR